MERYGKLTIENTFNKIRNNGSNRIMVNCLCDCGNKTTTSLDNLKNGHTTSCGCNRTKHGFAHHKLYGVWEGIVGRCCNPNNRAYKYYGGRGIKMHEDWRNDPASFIRWSIDNGWVQGLSIERVDVNGNYEPNNCKFIPMSLQNKNTRKAILIECNGITDTQRGWAKRLNMHPSTLQHRLKGSQEKSHQIQSMTDKK